MRSVATMVLLSILSATGVTQTGVTQKAEDDPHWRQEAVRRAFSEGSRGVTTGWTQKWMARLGDSAAPEVMKILKGKTITTKEAETALSIVDMSFATPSLILRNENRTPRNSLVLLDDLDQRVQDAPTREKIDAARQRILQQPNGAAPQK